jgi:hypothetical protein
MKFLIALSQLVESANAATNSDNAADEIPEGAADECRFHWNPRRERARKAAAR